MLEILTLVYVSLVILLNVVLLAFYMSISNQVN